MREFDEGVAIGGHRSGPTARSPAHDAVLALAAKRVKAAGVSRRQSLRFGQTPWGLRSRRQGLDSTNGGRRKRARLGSVQRFKGCVRPCVHGGTCVLQRLPHPLTQLQTFPRRVLFVAIVGLLIDLNRDLRFTSHHPPPLTLPHGRTLSAHSPTRWSKTRNESRR